MPKLHDMLLIHAQRPDAIACAELELWNEKRHRWVNRGAKGIALVDDTGPRRTVFQYNILKTVTDNNEGKIFVN